MKNADVWLSAAELGKSIGKSWQWVVNHWRHGEKIRRRRERGGWVYSMKDALRVSGALDDVSAVVSPTAVIEKIQWVLTGLSLHEFDRDAALDEIIRIVRTAQ